MEGRRGQPSDPPPEEPPLGKCRRPPCRRPQPRCLILCSNNLNARIIRPRCAIENPSKPNKGAGAAARSRLQTPPMRYLSSVTRKLLMACKWHSLSRSVQRCSACSTAADSDVAPPTAYQPPLLPRD